MKEIADLLDGRAADLDRGGSGPDEAWTEFENGALFAPAGPEVLAVRGEHVPRCIDATAGEPAFEDAVDRSVTEVVASRSQARGLWRSWRYPDLGRLTAGRRSYLIEVAAGTSPETSATLRRAAVERTGERALVIVFATDDALFAEHRAARSCSALLWAARPSVPIQVARVFDSVDAHAGPAFAPDHPRITDVAERERVLEYLSAGALLVGTAARMDDVVEPGRGRVVPVNLRTDGAWIWTDAVTYHLARYSLAPDGGLLDHIRGADPGMPEADGVALFRAAMALEDPDRRVENPPGGSEEPAP